MLKDILNIVYTLTILAFASMYYNIAKIILCMSLKFCIVMYKYYGPVAFNCKIKYLYYCIVFLLSYTT